MNKLLKSVWIAAALSVPMMANADWSIIGLGNLGGNYSVATDINDFGQVVGTSYNSAGNSIAFITGENGIGISSLGTLGGRSSSATAINNFGQVVGSSQISDGNTHAFITGINGNTMTDMGLSINSTFSYATDINDSGQIVGAFLTPEHTLHSFISTPTSDFIDLGTPGLSSDARGINNSGQVITSSEVHGTFENHIFLSDSNGNNLIDLGTLGGRSSSGTDINSFGQVVGGSKTANSGNANHAFLTDANGTNMIDLGTLGGIDSFSQGVNDLGEVVGTSSTYDSGYHSFIYSHGGMTDLSLLDTVLAHGWTNLVAIALNNNGQIVGYGSNSAGITEAFLLSYTSDTIFNPSPIFIPGQISPVPEPTTWVMFLVGLGLLGFMLHRRTQNA